MVLDLQDITLQMMTSLSFSSSSVLEIDPAKDCCKERLRPGRMLLVDTVNGRIN